MNVKDMAYYRNFNSRLQQSRYNSSKNKKNNGKKNNKNKVTVHIGFNYSGAMAQLANAKTRSQATALARSFRATLENAERWDSDANTIRAIKKAIGKAGVKVKALAKEERMESMKKVAESAKNIRRQMEIQEELNSKRNVRKRKERTDILDQDTISADRGNHTSSDSIDYYVYEGMDTSCCIEITEGAVVDMEL